MLGVFISSLFFREVEMRGGVRFPFQRLTYSKTVCVCLSQLN